MKKIKLSIDGTRILKLLTEEYNMEEEADLRLMEKGGRLLAMALIAMVKR